MKNITEQKPSDPLHGRTAFVVQFVKDKDIKNKKILDIGCGYGWFELFARRKGAQQVIGTELSEKDLITAKKYINDPKIKFIEGSAISLPLTDKSVETVVSWEVIEHIPTDTEVTMFQEVHRVLKKGGVFYLSTPHRNIISTFFDPAWWLIGHRHYLRGELENFASQTGFIVEQCTVRGGLWEVLWLLNLYCSKWIFHRTPILAEYFEKKLTDDHTTREGFTNIYFRFVKKD